MPFNRVIRGEKFSNYKIIIDNKKGVRYREISGTPVYDSDGNFQVGVLISRDITDRLKNETSIILKAQYDLLSRMIENLELGIIRLSYPEFIYCKINY